MSKKRSDALQSLVVEVVDLAVEVALARDAEDEAKAEFAAAQAALDLRRQKRADLEERRDTTHKALTLIRNRDDIAEETVKAMIDRQAGR